MEMKLQPGSAFSCANVPDGLYSLGGDFFVYANQWNGAISIHIRKFTTFQSTYYPSREGVTISFDDFSSLIKDGFDMVRNTMEYWIRDEDCEYLEDFKLRVCCFPAKMVTLSRQATGSDGARVSSVTLNQDQWTQLKYMSECVSTDAGSIRFENVDLVSRFKTCTPLSEVESDEVFNEQLVHYLKSALIHTLFKYGVGPYCEETENTVGLLNSVCMNLNVLDVMNTFFISTSKKYTNDGRQLSTCVTAKFLKEVDFIALIHEFREPHPNLGS